MSTTVECPNRDLESQCFRGQSTEAILAALCAPHRSSSRVSRPISERAVSTELALTAYLWTPAYFRSG